MKEVRGFGSGRHRRNAAAPLTRGTGNNDFYDSISTGSRLFDAFIVTVLTGSFHLIIYVIGFQLRMFSMRHLMSLVGVISAGVFVSPSHATNFTQACRYLPGDKDWPTVHDWLELNSTVHGRLISTVPLAAPCYGASLDAVACDDIKDKWVQPELQYAHRG